MASIMFDTVETASKLVVGGSSNGLSKTRVILVSMVKNESRILKRLMDSVKSYIDGYVICDTGSTDHTVELATNYIRDNEKDGAVVQIPWVNFGISRTSSVTEAVKWVAEKAKAEGSDWSPFHTWGLLLDGDMVLPDPVDKAELAKTTADAVLLNQRNHVIIYKNVRLLRLDREWKCLGATHEYWDTGNNKVCWENPTINDLNDGGSKADKFERDARLLEAELDEKPRNERTLFYLGQTYQSLNKKKESNEMLQRRIDVGGWEEEIYMSHLYRGDNFICINEEEKAVCEWLAAWQKMPCRTEAALRVISHYRKRSSMQFVAMLYLEKLVALQLGQTLMGRPLARPAIKNDSLLFVSHIDMKFSIWEELAILGFYSDYKKEAWLRTDHQIILAHHDWNARNHLLSFQRWYDKKLPVLSMKRLRLDPAKAPWAGEEDAGIWEPFNPSIRTDTKNGRYELFLRHANYSTVDAKNFPYRGRSGFVITRNVYTRLDKNLDFVDSPRELVIPKESIFHPNHHIQGIEDCRFIQNSELPLALATSQNMTETCINKIQCVMWNPDSFAVSTAQMKLPNQISDKDCQKNWLPFLHNNEPHYVFRINPFTICNFDAIPTLQFMPSGGFTLDGLRGSAAPVPFLDGWLMVVHYSHYNDGGRRYYHRFIMLDQGLKPLLLSCSFRLSDQNIEYVSGMTRSLDGDSYLVTFGVNDSEAYLANVVGKTISDMLCYNLQTGETNLPKMAEFLESF